jgi:hypothetical protein
MTERVVGIPRVLTQQQGNLAVEHRVLSAEPAGGGIWLLSTEYYDLLLHEKRHQRARFDTNDGSVEWLEE